MNVTKHALERFFQRVPGVSKMKQGYAAAEILKNINKHRLIARDSDGNEWYRGDIKTKGADNKHPYAICLNPTTESVLTIYGEGMVILRDLTVGSPKYYVPYQALELYKGEMAASVAVDTLNSLLNETREQNKRLKNKLKSCKTKLYMIDVWSCDDIARFTGKSRRTVERMFKTGKIKGVQKSGVWLAHREEVLELVKRCE